MTTFHDEAVECPACGSSLQACVITSTNTVGTDSDLMPHTSGLHAVPLMISACDCGYADFAGRMPQTRLTARQKHDLLESDLPHFFAPGRDLPSYRRYELAARARAVLADPPYDLAGLHLRASWCVRLEGADRAESLALEEFYRRTAVELFRRAVVESALPAEDWRTAVYLIAELSRLNGAFDDAVRGFDRFLNEVNDDVNFRRAVQELRRRAELRDRAVARFSELIR